MDRGARSAARRRAAASAFSRRLATSATYAQMHGDFGARRARRACSPAPGPVGPSALWALVVLVRRRGPLGLGPLHSERPERRPAGVKMIRFRACGPRGGDLRRWCLGTRVVDAQVLETLEDELARDSDMTRSMRSTAAFARFEETQPALSRRTWRSCSAGRSIEVALALGYFLSIAIRLSFDRLFGNRVGAHRRRGPSRPRRARSPSKRSSARATASSRSTSRDVVAIEQPGIVAFVHGHVEAACSRRSPKRAKRARSTSTTCTRSTARSSP